MALQLGIEKRSDFDIRGKWFKYAMQAYPMARESELEVLLSRLKPRPGEKILDAASGDGYVAKKILASVKDTEVVCIDNSEVMASQARKELEYVICSMTDILLPDKSFDKIANLASFHHVEDKERAIRELYRVLRNKGRIVLADVANGTPPQRFFDEIVDSYSITGHKAEFVTPNECIELFEGAGFRNVQAKIENVSWRFDNISQMTDFVYHLFGLMKTSPERIESSVKEYLGIEISNSIRMNWQLVYVTGTKNGPEK